ncbi:MAG TPA: M1 family aminopeptidase [Bacteroidota bacterium]|nr:M1 family aminopeptidase [Bacteroidota bacterium]
MMKPLIVTIAVMLFVACAQVHTQELRSAQTESFTEHVRAEMERYRVRAQLLARARLYVPIADVKYYRLNLRIADQKNFLSGDVTTLARVTDASATQITYDLNNTMKVDSAFVDGVRAQFSQNQSTLQITLVRPYNAGDLVTTRVYYRGNPAYTGLGSYADAVSAEGSRWVYTLSEPYGARDWWPCIDHPSDKADSADIVLTCAQTLTPVSNGMLADTVRNTDSTKTYTWKERYPISTYLIAATIGNFTKVSDWYKYAPTDSMEVTSYVLPTIAQSSPQYRQNLALVPRMLEVYSSMFGQYPFIKEKYGQVEFGWGGGMEHQTLTSLGSRAFTEGTIAHELAHQWFGDMITCRTWGDLWLNEGFAQYCEALWRERQYGAAAYASVMASRINDAKNAQGTLFVKDTGDVNNLFNYTRVYQKGSWVLHMLRHAVGDSMFFASMRAYAHDPSVQYGTASTADVRRVFEQTTGKDLAWFFNEWVFGESYPRYVCTLSSAAEGQTYRAQVRIQQTTGTINPAFFTMPVDLKFFSGSWDTTLTITTNAQDQTAQFVLSHKPDSLQFDPQNWILRDVTRANTSVAGVEGVPLDFSLSQNFPNPFNPSTVVSFSVPRQSRVSIRIYDITGREVAVLTEGERPAGFYHLPLTMPHGASGVYLCRMTAVHTAGVFSETRKLLLLR